MNVLEVETLFDKHKDNEKSQSREITSHKFYEVLVIWYHQEGLVKIKRNMSLYCFISPQKV